MTPDDPRHGTVAGYVAGCREQSCRAAKWAYEKRRRLDTHFGRNRTCDVEPARRRIQALMAIGWTQFDIGRAAGWKCGDNISQINRPGYERITGTSMARVEKAYRLLSMTPGPSDRMRKLSRTWGYHPPLAWDNIDDLNEQPHTGEPDTKQIDEVVVLRAMSGRPVKATKAERLEIIRRWQHAGRPTVELERILPTANVWRDIREGNAA